MKLKFTLANVAAVEPGPVAYDLSDTEQRGLVLRVRPNGVHSWLVRIGARLKDDKQEGRPARWCTLGRADVIPVKKARELASAKLIDDAGGNDPIVAKRLARRHAATLGDFITKKYTPWASEHLRTTNETGARVAATFPDFLSKRLSEITPFAVERWRVARHKDGVSPSTTNRDLDGLRSVLSKAVAWGLLKEHPLRTVRRATLDTRGRLRFLSPTEEQQLRDALTAREAKLRAGRASFNAWRAARGYKLLPDYTGYVDHLQPLVLTALLTGARRGELFDLRWGAVDLTRAVVTFAGETTKSGLSRRVPLCPEAAKVLTAWRGQQSATQQEADALVFPSPQTGERLDNISTAWAKLVKDAKLDDFTFHSLRHSFASKLVQRGVDLFAVQKLLGHASPVMTQRYSHLADEHLTAAVAKLG